MEDGNITEWIISFDEEDTDVDQDDKIDLTKNELRINRTETIEENLSVIQTTNILRVNSNVASIERLRKLIGNIKLN